MGKVADLEAKLVTTARKLRCRISFPSAAVRKCARKKKKSDQGEKGLIFCLVPERVRSVVAGKAWRQEHEMDLSRCMSSLKAQRKQ